MSLRKRILNEVATLPKGSPIYAKALLHLGSRAAVDQALSRLARRGQLLRVGTGLYSLPIETRFGTRAPSAETLVEALNSAGGESIVPSGASAANKLGFTTQVPLRTVYLTSGRSRLLHIGAHTVELEHAPTWQLVPGAAGDVIRALAWLGKDKASEVTAQLRRALSSQTLEALAHARPQMPTWMAAEVSMMVADA